MPPGSGRDQAEAALRFGGVRQHPEKAVRLRDAVRLGPRRYKCFHGEVDDCQTMGMMEESLTVFIN
jgi:hypothetical protein